MQRLGALAKLVLRPAASKVLGANITPRAGIIAAQAVRVSFRSFGGQAAHGHGADEPFLDPKVVSERIMTVVKNFEKVQAAKVSAAARFKEDLDLDSLDAVEVVMAIEEEFGIEIPDSEADKILSIADAVKYIQGHPMAK